MRKIFQLIIIVIIITFALSNQETNISIKLIEKVKQKLNEQKYHQIENDFKNKRQLTIDMCDQEQVRQANMVVDIGVGNRKYYAKTNAYNQVDAVFAKELILQDETKELTQTNGRYCKEEANVAGTELKAYDQGHIIADSLGGVSNAYNITPENSKLNRSGMQREMEKALHDALVDQKHVTNFYGQIFYSNHNTLIPSRYLFTFEINNRLESYQFNNE